MSGSTILGCEVKLEKMGNPESPIVSYILPRAPPPSASCHPLNIHANPNDSSTCSPELNP